MRLSLPINLIIVVTLLFSAFTAVADNFETKATHAILLDESTHTVLYEKQAPIPMTPSSMSKLMTLYILFDRIKSGSVKMTDKFRVSERAWKTGGSKMFVKVDTEVAVEDLIRGIIVQSGNDACVVVAENIAGSETSFANLMNEMASKLELKASSFRNSTGMPEEGHVMSAQDLAILAERLIDDFPEFYHYFSEKEFTYNKIRQPNRDLLLSREGGFDGLKTGHTEEAGYGMVASALRDGRRIIGVVNGLKNEKERADEAQKLIEYGFHDFEKITLLKKGQVIETADVWFGKRDTVGLKAADDVVITIPRFTKGQMQAQVVYDSPIKAPIKEGDQVATLMLKRKNTEDMSIPLVAAEDVGKLSIFKHIWRAAKYHVNKHRKS